jgi:Fe2+ transport system protein FeoA
MKTLDFQFAFKVRIILRLILKMIRSPLESLMSNFSLTTFKFPRNSLNSALFEIVELNNELGIAERLMEIGLSPGTTFRVSQKLPFNGPWILDLQQQSLALRHEEARCLIVIKRN